MLDPEILIPIRRSNPTGIIELSSSIKKSTDSYDDNGGAFSDYFI